MDNKIDSSPCADDHSSPRSPRHVLILVNSSNQNLDMIISTLELI